MASERTLSIIKPDATRRNITGKINAMIEDAGLRIVAQKRAKWKKADAEAFYKVHKERPFFKDLVKFMTSGPIVLQVLEGDNAVARYRKVMGATNPADAAPAPFARTLPNRSRPTRCTAPTVLKMPRKRSGCASRRPRSSAEATAARSSKRL